MAGTFALIIGKVKKVRLWRIVVPTLVLGTFVFLSGISSWPDRLRGTRPVNERDELFRYAAQELAEPAICEKIPWSAISPGGFFLASSYERSNCYAYVAGRAQHLSVCWKVRRLGAFSFLSRQTSMWSCLNDAWHGLNAGIAVPPASLVDFFGRIGYDPDALHLEGLTPPLVSVKAIFEQLPHQPEIAARIEKAIGDVHSSTVPGKDATDVAYLADVAALITENANWCARISEDVRLPNQSTRFRDWCFFTLATNTKNAEICRRIPIRAEEGDARLSLQANCGRQVTSAYPNGRYGPEVPESDERTRALIAMLDVEVPRARSLPIETIATGYDRFLSELNNGRDTVHLAARQRFVERVRRLTE
jgi:hypothetical protein